MRAMAQKSDNLRFNPANLEARVGIEPTHKGFADLSLTTWVPRPEQAILNQRANRRPAQDAPNRLERETGLEPATLALARRCSTTELLPLGSIPVLSILTSLVPGRRHLVGRVDLRVAA